MGEIWRWAIMDPPTFLFESGLSDVRTLDQAGAIYKGEVEVVAAEQMRAAVDALREVIQAAGGVTQVRNGASAERWHRALAGAEAVLDRNGGRS